MCQNEDSFSAIPRFSEFFPTMYAIFTSIFYEIFVGILRHFSENAKHIEINVSKFAGVVPNLAQNYFQPKFPELLIFKSE